MGDETPIRGLDDGMLPEPLRYVYEMVKRQAERSVAFEAETQKKFDFIIEQQAQLTATVGRMAEKVDRTASSITNLLAIAELHDREIAGVAESVQTVADSVKVVSDRLRDADERGRQTDERLDALIGAVERIISDRQNGKA